MSTLLGAALLVSSPTASTGWNQGAAEGTLWQLLNGARANNGMAPLQQHSTLVSLARWRSRDMLDRDYFSHTIPGCGCLVYAYYDSNGLNYVWGGENIGWNSGRSDAESPVRVHEQFMGSPGHRANVLNRAFTHGGVGAAAADNKKFQGYVQNTRMYTELFMQAPAASAPAPAPAPAQAPPAPAQPAAPPSQPAPAAPPPSGGGGGAAAPAQPVGQAPARAKAPKPKIMKVDAPRRPTSTAGVDGASVRVSRATVDLAKHHRLDELAAARASRAMGQQAVTAATAVTPVLPASVEVDAAPPASPGFLESIVGAVMGFLFG